MLLKMNTNKKLHLGFLLLFQKYGKFLNTYFTRGNIIKYKFSHLPFFTLEPFGELHKCIAFFFQCKKVFPRRQNYHFHRTKGRCPGAPQPPKYHKLYESKYYCVHPDCGSGDGELRDNTPCFTSRGTTYLILKPQKFSTSPV